MSRRLVDIGFTVPTAMSYLANEDFCWAKVLTKAGEIDVVASPDLLDGYIVKDGILSCHCYLSGRIMNITDVDSLME